MNQSLKAIPVPNDWDRRGLPGWTYHWKRINSLGVLAALPGVHRVLAHKYYCDEDAYLYSGRSFCSKHCAEFFFFEDPED